MSHSGLWFLVFGGGGKRILQKNPTLLRYIACRKPFSVRESLSLSNKSLPFPKHLPFIFSSNPFFSLISSFSFFLPYLIGFPRSSPSSTTRSLMRSCPLQSHTAVAVLLLALFLFALVRGFFCEERCGLLRPAFIHPCPCLKFLAFPVSSPTPAVFARFVLWVFFWPNFFGD